MRDKLVVIQPYSIFDAKNIFDNEYKDMNCKTKAVIKATLSLIGIITLIATVVIGLVIYPKIVLHVVVVSIYGAALSLFGWFLYGTWEVLRAYFMDNCKPRKKRNRRGI